MRDRVGRRQIVDVARADERQPGVAREPCEDRVLTLDGTRWRLDRPFAQWRTAEDGTAQ